MTGHFPRGRGVRTTRTVVCVTLLGLAAGLLFSPAVGDRKDELENRQETLSDKVSSARRDLDASSGAYARATSALEAASARLSSARSELADVLGKLDAARIVDQQMQARLAQAEQRLAGAEAALDEATVVVDDQQTRIERFALRTYATSDPSLVSLNLVLSGESPTDLSASISAAESVVESQTADLDGLDAARIMQSLREQRVEQMRDAVAVERALAAENLVRLGDLAAQARTQTQAVRELVEQNRVLRDRARAARDRDLQVLREMEQERERVHDQLLALARQQAQAQQSSTPPTTPSTTTSSGDGGGYLDYPINGGYVTSPYGMRMHPILHVYKLHDGTDFGAACGTPVYASAAGTIVSAYYNAGYGNRIIMNHGIVNGVSLSTSYNHLTSFVAGVGQHVGRGQLIAYSGTTGYSTGCHLHFMVYVNGATVDPMGWL